MSTGTKMPREKALRIADEFLALFVGTYDHWYFGGSLRRARPLVGDLEHIIMPKFVPVPTDRMFGPPESTNAVWQKCDELVRNKLATKAVYGDTKANRWGDKYRGIVWGGVKHELFTADAFNLGSILTIRTGPAAFSELCVTELKRTGRYRQEKGYVRKVIGGDISLHTDAIVPVPTEESFLTLCGIPNIQPEERDAYMEHQP